jgi:2-polyprenyl-6-methoxyphenol hydroxylase-like FAD-dependent oxidoreductase
MHSSALSNGLTETEDRGQGANNAFKDAREYVMAMVAVQNGMPLNHAMQKYQDEVVARGAKEVALSRDQTVATHNIAMLPQAPTATYGAGPSSVVV